MSLCHIFVLQYTSRSLPYTQYIQKSFHSIRIITNSITIIVSLVSGRVNLIPYFIVSLIYIFYFFVVLKIRQMTDRQNCVLYWTHTLQNSLMSITCSFLSRIQNIIVDTIELSFRELLFCLVVVHILYVLYLPCGKMKSYSLRTYEELK